MRPLRLRTRMFAWFLGLATALVAVAGAAHWFETREALIELVDQDLLAHATEIAARHAAGQPLEPDVEKAARAMRGFEVYAADTGAVVARSASLRPDHALVEPAQVLVCARQGTPTFASRRISGLGHVRVAALRARPGRSSGDAPRDPGVVVAVVHDLRHVDEEIRDTLIWSAATMGIALALSAFAAWLASGHLTRPLRRIASTAAEIERTGVATAIPKSGAADEVDALSAALERAFRHLQDALERQSRFASDAAHELRTPTAGILAQAEVAVRRERTPEEYRRTLETIVAAGRRMQETLEALMLVARGDRDSAAVRSGNADLVAVAGVVIASTGELARSHDVDVRLAAPASAPLAGDPRLLEILVRNLVENAIAHSPAGAVVDVEVAATGPEVTLRVRDQGEGIPAEALPHVFERFFRSDPSRSRTTGGAGLGLALVQQIAVLHGGRANVKSPGPGGRGAMVTVTLPIAPRAPTG